MIDFAQFQQLGTDQKLDYLYQSHIELHANWLRWNRYVTWAILAVGGLLGVDIGGFV